MLFIVLANAVVLLLGGTITHLAYRAYHRTGLEGMKYFTVGFGLITLGALFGGGLHQIAGMHVLVGIPAPTSLTGVGFGILAYSLYAEEPDRSSLRPGTNDSSPRQCSLAGTGGSPETGGFTVRWPDLSTIWKLYVVSR